MGKIGKMFKNWESQRVYDKMKKELRTGALKNETLVLTLEDKNKELQQKLIYMRDENNRIQMEIDEENKKVIILNVMKDMPKKSLKTRLIEFIKGSKEEDKVKGFVFHMDKNYGLTIYDVLSDNFDNLFKIKHNATQGEAYNLNKYFGMWKNRRFFLTKFPHAISLDLDTETLPDLKYDAPAYYNILEHKIKGHITKGEPSNIDAISDLLKNYWLPIAIILGIIGFLMSPQGKELLKGLNLGI